MIERIALSQGGRVISVDPATNTIVTDFGNYEAQVANVIPPQKAGRIARRSRQRFRNGISGDSIRPQRLRHGRAWQRDYRRHQAGKDNRDGWSSQRRPP